MGDEKGKLRPFTFKVKVNRCYLGATKASVRRFWVHHFHPARASNLPQTLPNQSFPRNHWLPWGNCFHNHWKPKVWLKIVPIKLWTVLQNNKSQILTLPHRHKMSGETPFLKKVLLMNIWLAIFDSVKCNKMDPCRANNQTPPLPWLSHNNNTTSAN